MFLFEILISKATQSKYILIILLGLVSAPSYNSKGPCPNKSVYHLLDVDLCFQSVSGLTINMLQFSVKTIRHGICVDDVSRRSNIHSISSLTPAAEMCGNVLPYFWHSCARNTGGEKVKATWCTPRFPNDPQQRMKPPCVGGQEPKHQPRAWSSYQSRQTSTCQLRLFLGPVPSRRG